MCVNPNPIFSFAIHLVFWFFFWPTNINQQQSEPKHLKQTENLVIQPQSLALSHDQPYAAITPSVVMPTPSNMIAPFSPPNSHTINPNENFTAAQPLATSNATADEPIIFPDEMVS